VVVLQRTIELLKETNMFKLDTLRWISLILLVAGGFDWGLVGLFRFDPVAAVFGEMLARIAYVVVGLSAMTFLVPALAGVLSPKAVRTQGSLATRRHMVK
jgi:uncharacterized membrane protein YuzA (DUF378 family)